MKIRIKILLILGLIILALMAGFYAVGATLMFSSIATSENQHFSENAAVFKRSLTSALEALGDDVTDWANWDDTYNFVQTNDSRYVASNVVDETFDNLQVNLVLFFNQDGDLVLGKLYDLETQTTLPLNETTVNAVKGYSELFISDPETAQNGLILVEGKPMLAAAHVILTSTLQGPPQGTLIFCRYLDDQELSSITAITLLPVTVEPYSDITSGDFLTAKNSLTQAQPIFTQTLNEGASAGYVLLNDVSGAPLLIARVADAREEYAQGVVALGYFSLFLIGMYVVTFLCIAFLLDRIVISRLSNLNSAVTNFRSGAGIRARVKDSGSDELSSLGKNINGMLDAIVNNTISLENTVRERTRDLTENKKKLESILQASPDAIVAFDLNCNITECNTRILELSGYTRSFLIGKPCIDFFVEKSRQQVKAEVTSLLAKDTGAQRFEVFFLKKAGVEIPVEFSINLVKDEWDYPVGAVGVIRDLSEKKMLEQQLLKSQRLAAIGELAGMVGHDIRNPLAAIKNADYYIKKKCRDCKNSQIRPMLEIIDKSIEHADSIVDDLLEYSRELNLEILPWSAKMLVEKALLMIQVPDRVKLVNSVADVPLQVDESKVLRVFVNLVKNAIEAMPEGGTLTIASQHNTDYTSVSFSDTGKGISDEVLSKLFTPLFTTKAQGMGFGLSISKRIVEAHGGKISVQTALKKGTTFTVAFPNSSRPTETMNATL